MAANNSLTLIGFCPREPMPVGKPPDAFLIFSLEVELPNGDAALYEIKCDPGCPGIDGVPLAGRDLAVSGYLSLRKIKGKNGRDYHFYEAVATSITPMRSHR